MCFLQTTRSKEKKKKKEILRESNSTERKDRIEKNEGGTAMRAETENESTRNRSAISPRDSPARIPRPCLLNIPIAACINVYSQIFAEWKSNQRKRVDCRATENCRLNAILPPILMDPYPLEPVCSS